MNHPLPPPVNDDEARLHESLTEDESTVSLADLEAGAPPLAAPNGARRRKRWMLASLLLVLLLGGAGVGAYFLYMGQRVDVRANRRTTQTATNGSGIQRAAFASLSEALGPAPVTPPPSVPAVNIGSGQDAEVTMAGVPKTKEVPSAGAESVPAPPPANVQAGIAATLAPPPEVLLAQNNQAKNNPSGQRNSDGNKTNVQPQPNPAHSLRFAPLPTPEPTPAQTGSRVATDRRSVPVNQNNQADRFTPVSASLRQRAPAPAFGTMLPVRLLGVLHTLRPGALARLELLRDIATERGTVKRGTVFIGAVTSGEMNRAYVQIKGFIAAGEWRLHQTGRRSLGERRRGGLARQAAPGGSGLGQGAGSLRAGGGRNWQQRSWGDRTHRSSLPPIPMARTGRRPASQQASSGRTAASSKWRLARSDSSW